MNLAGWIFIQDKMSWTKVFNIDISYDKDFSFVPIEDVQNELVQCDLNGVVKNIRKKSHVFFHDMLDIIFKVYGVNFKNNYCDVRTVMYDKKCLDYIDDSISYERITYSNIAVANVTLIDKQYAYFNCTSYEFWKPIKNFIYAEFDSINLGGKLVKLGIYKEIDNFLKDIL